jgi:hypothetical protein
VGVVFDTRLINVGTKLNVPSANASLKQNTKERKMEIEIWFGFNLAQGFFIGIKLVKGFVLNYLIYT